MRVDLDTCLRIIDRADAEMQRIQKQWAILVKRKARAFKNVTPRKSQ